MKKLFLYGAIAAGMMLTACQSEDLIVNNEEQVRTDVDRTYYVNVSIHGDNFTRAASDNGNPEAGTDFDNGVGNESTVNNVYFVFYDAAGNVVGNLINVQGSELTDLWNTGTENTVEKYYQKVLQIDVPKTSQDPTSVICYINPIVPQALQTDLANIQTVTRTSVKTDRGFAMSNSVFYTGETATEPQVAVSVVNKLYKTSEQASAADAQSVDIYVERYATKLAFSLDESKIADYGTQAINVNTEGSTTDRIDVSLKFNDVKWALNAEANELYMIKSFRKPSTTGLILPENYTFAELNGIINPSLTGDAEWVWNNPTYNRSYWAISPAYFTSAYPEVSSDLDPDNGWAGKQTYLTFDEILGLNGKTATGFDVVAENGVSTQYFRETTVGRTALNGGNPRAAVPSVLICGFYDVTVNNTTYAKQTFYTYGKNTANKSLIYFPNEANSLESTIPGTQSILSRLISASSLIYYSEDGTTFTQATAEQIAKYASVDKYVNAAEKKIASRMRTLVLNEDAVTSNSNLYIAAANGFNQIVPNNTAVGNNQMTLDDANENIFQQVGTAELYNNGQAYFSIPVMHYGWYRKGNPNAGVTSLNDIDWKKVNVGDFGMVRNHSYKVQVNGITGLGTGVGDGGDPIVPPADSDEYYVSYKINILKWAVVPTQGVTLD